jgi:hypothetical protein
MNTGGPAFPTSADNGHSTNQDGMTLRDYFAAKAMQSILLEYQNVFEDETGGEGDPTFPELLAKDAYIMADAMLKVREQ